jgi:glycine dehydrogenase subunit 1
MTDIRYLPTTKAERQEMLKAIGKPSIESLFEDIPPALRLSQQRSISTDFPTAHSEQELVRHFKKLVAVNNNRPMLNFLGGGIYPTFIPAVVKEVAFRSEFYSAYTPYAPEISQGMLQTLWEYQSYICELTDMDAANSSMYDWASAIAEAALMCRRVIKKKKICLLPEILCQNRLSAIKTYISGSDVQLRFVKYNRQTGQVDLDSLREQLAKNNVCGVYLESPNFFGVIEENAEEIGELVHQNEALFVMGVQPLSLGILESPGALGADIAVGEGQQLGNAMNFGGPLLGIFACKDDRQLLRQMPGRIIGYTRTKDDLRDAFIMTLQTREQHIRREKATSNICTNQALVAVVAVIYMAVLGKRGLRELGEGLIARSTYLMKQLAEISGVSIPFYDSPHHREFVVRLPADVDSILAKMYEEGIYAGINLAKAFPDLDNAMLVNTTEIHTQKDLDVYVNTLKDVLEEK